MLPKIDVADDIVCSSVQRLARLAGIGGRGGLCCGLLTEGRQSRKGGGSAGTDGMTLVLTRTIILVGMGRSLGIPIKENLSWKYGKHVKLLSVAIDTIKYQLKSCKDLER